MNFEILSDLRRVETIARGVGIRDRKRLTKSYGRGSWRKRKGVATIQLDDGTVLEAELHWYEAHGIGKKEIKFKKPVRA